VKVNVGKDLWERRRGKGVYERKKKRPFGEKTRHDGKQAGGRKAAEKIYTWIHSP